MATESAQRASFVPGWTFADKFRKARIIAELEQREFAERLNLTPSTVAAYETGRSAPRFRDVANLAKRIQLLTGIDYQWFLDTDFDAVEANRGPSDYRSVASLDDYRRTAAPDGGEREATILTFPQGIGA